MRQLATTTIDQIGFSFEMFDGMGKQRPAGTTSGTLADVHLGANSAAHDREHDQQHDHRDHLGLPQRLRGQPTPTATRSRRRWRQSAQVRECLARQFFRSSSGRSDDSDRQRRAVLRRHLEADVLRSAGQVHRGAGRLRAQPAVRSTERPVKKRSASRRSFLKAVGASATALPFYRLLENSFAQAAGRSGPAAVLRHLPPARHRGRVLRDAGRQVLGLTKDTETAFNLTYTNNGTQCVAAAVRRRHDLRPELQEQDPRHRGHRPDVERQRPRHGRDDPDRQLHRQQQAASNSSLDQYMAVERKLGAATRGDQHRASASATTARSRARRCRSVRAARRCPRSSTRCRRSTRCSRATSRPTIRRRPAAAMRARAKGRSVIDFVTKDISRMNTRLAAVEQQKLQQHLDSIRDLEKQFDEPTTGGRRARPARCRASRTRRRSRRSSATTAASRTST